MAFMKSGQTIGVWIFTFIAVVFGALTIKSGGSVLFIDGPAREAAGNYVPFVLWFNFLAGFLYIVTGIGLFMKKRWAALMAIFLFVATLIVFALFGLHVLNEGLYEFRTVVAMSLRTVIWASIAAFAYRAIIRQ